MPRLDKQTINPGFQFKNNSMRLTVVLFHETDKRNLVLLVRENDTCPYITVRDLSETGNGGYDWAWGGTTSPILTMHSKITANGFPTCCKSIF